MTDARKRFPDAKLTWFVEEQFADLARLHPGVDDVVEVAARRWRRRLGERETWREMRAFRARIKAIPSDIVIDTQGLIRSGVMARIANGVSHGYDSASIREPLACLFYDVRHPCSRELHAVTRNRLLTGASLGYRPEEEIDYGLPIASGSGSTPYALLFHSTSREAKEWGEADWIAVGRWLRNQGFEVLAPWGSERERQRSLRFATAVPCTAPERLRLDAMAQLVAGASLAVGVDTGLLHLAAAHRVPLVAIFLATRPGLTGPVGSGPIEVVGGDRLYPSAQEVIQAAARQLAKAR